MAKTKLKGLWVPMEVIADNNILNRLEILAEYENFDYDKFC